MLYYFFRYAIWPSQILVDDKYCLLLDYFTFSRWWLFKRNLVSLNKKRSIGCWNHNCCRWNMKKNNRYLFHDNQKWRSKHGGFLLVSSTPGKRQTKSSTKYKNLFVLNFQKVGELDTQMKRLDARINGSIEDNLEVNAQVTKRSSSSVSSQQLDTSMVWSVQIVNVNYLCYKMRM